MFRIVVDMSWICALYVFDMPSIVVSYDFDVSLVCVCVDVCVCPIIVGFRFEAISIAVRYVAKSCLMLGVMNATCVRRAFNMFVYNGSSENNQHGNVCYVACWDCAVYIN